MAEAILTRELSALSARLFEDIAAAAADLVLTLTQTPSAEDDAAGADLALRTMRHAVSRIGWLADIGAKRNGGLLALGETEDWLLSAPLRVALSDADAQDVPAGTKRDDDSHGEVPHV